MSTTVINPGTTESSSNAGAGLVLGIVLLIVFGILFFVYGFPYIQRGFGGNYSGGGTNINVPKDINVNVKQSK